MNAVQEELLERMIQSGALLEGHFKLSSGLHSGNYLQCALLLSHPQNAAFVGEELAKIIKDFRPDVVVSPAMGGLIVGHEVARALGVPFLFSERVDGQMQLRRFPHPGKVRFIIVEDVITTGKSTIEAAAPLIDGGAEWVGVACIADRTGGDHSLPLPLHSLIALDFPVYEPGGCPICAGNIPLVKPGSRPSTANL